MYTISTRTREYTCNTYCEIAELLENKENFSYCEITPRDELQAWNLNHESEIDNFLDNDENPDEDKEALRALLEDIADNSWSWTKKVVRVEDGVDTYYMPCSGVDSLKEAVEVKLHGLGWGLRADHKNEFLASISELCDRAQYARDYQGYTHVILSPSQFRSTEYWRDGDKDIRQKKVPINEYIRTLDDMIEARGYISGRSLIKVAPYPEGDTDWQNKCAGTISEALAQKSYDWNPQLERPGGIDWLEGTSEVTARCGVILFGERITTHALYQNPKSGEIKLWMVDDPDTIIETLIPAPAGTVKADDFEGCFLPSPAEYLPQSQQVSGEEFMDWLSTEGSIWAVLTPAQMAEIHEEYGISDYVPPEDEEEVNGPHP